MNEQNTDHILATTCIKEQKHMVTFKKRCPCCGKISFYRIRREWWMRLIPGTKRYYCLECREKFIVLWPKSIGHGVNKFLTGRCEGCQVPRRPGVILTKNGQYSVDFTSQDLIVFLFPRRINRKVSSMILLQEDHWALDRFWNHFWHIYLALKYPELCLMK